LGSPSLNDNGSIFWFDSPSLKDDGFLFSFFCLSLNNDGFTFWFKTGEIKKESRSLAEHWINLKK
jgi:hypothetical protein